MNAYAVIHPGLEDVVDAELSGLGVTGEVCPGGVRFSIEPAAVPALVRKLRTPSQVLVELATGSARSAEGLATVVRRVPWRDWLHPQAEVKVDVSSRGSALRFKESVSRSVFGVIREARKGPFIPDRGSRPRFAQSVQVRIVEDAVTVSIDAGGELLHRRGWRTEAGKAPIRENLAACLLALAEWDGSDALYDPFCGSGTLVIEGALLALGRSPFVNRGFACEEWPLVAAGARGGRGGTPTPPPRGKGTRPGGPPVRGASAAPLAVPAGIVRAGLGPRAAIAKAGINAPILGSDHHAPTLLSAKDNARRAGVPVEFRLLEIADIEPPSVVGTIVANLPYGERLGERVEGVYGAFGHVLRERFASWRVVFLTTDRRLAERVDRRVERITQFKNGGIGVGVFSFLP